MDNKKSWSSEPGVVASLWKNENVFCSSQKEPVVSTAVTSTVTSSKSVKDRKNYFLDKLNSARKTLKQLKGIESSASSSSQRYSENANTSVVLFGARTLLRRIWALFCFTIMSHFCLFCLLTYWLCFCYFYFSPLAQLISIPNLHITKETRIHTYVQMLVRASYLGANNSCRI